MRKFVKGIGRNSMLSVLLCIASVTAMESSLNKGTENRRMARSDTTAFIRLQNQPQCDFSMGVSQIAQGQLRNGLKLLGKYVMEAAPPKPFEPVVLRRLLDLSRFDWHGSIFQLQAAYCAHQYVISVNIPAVEAFSIHLNYYNLLMQMNKQSKIQLGVLDLVCNYAVKGGVPEEALPTYLLLKQTKDLFVPLTTELFRVGSILKKIAEENIEKFPHYLFEFAQTQEVDVQEPKDLTCIVDMYRRAAHNGCTGAASVLAESSHFCRILENMVGIQEATNLLARYGQKQGLLNLYNQKKNPVFLVILSLIGAVKEEKIDQDVKDLLAPYVGGYPLAMDLNNYQVLNSKLKAKEKESQQEKERKVEVISAQKAQIIHNLSAKDQFKLAQEYKLVNEAIYTMLVGSNSIIRNFEKTFRKINFASEQRYFVAEQVKSSLNRWHNYDKKFEDFHKGYVQTLEESARKGYLPAVEELEHLYSPQGVFLPHSVIPSAEKTIFYAQLKDILTNEDLGLMERATKFQEAYKK